jgi:phosphatidylglycerol:prolipoprotein diacylglycerol transferase
MIPYTPEPVFHVGSREIHLGTVLVVLGILVGGAVVLWRARRSGVETEEAFRFSFSIYAGGMAGAYLIWNPLLTGKPGAWSFGGFLGAFLGALAYCVVARWPLVRSLERMDLAVFAAPIAAMFGRLGCTVAHHHRGIVSSSWLAVDFPEGPRYDLGLLEFLFLFALSVVVFLLGRTRRVPGFFLSLFAIAYGSFRMALDTLRDDSGARYWPGAVAVALGLIAINVSRRIALPRAV